MVAPKRKAKVKAPPTTKAKQTKAGADGDPMVGAPAELWEETRKRVDWYFQGPAEDYEDVHVRTPGQTRWSPQSGQVLKLLELYPHAYRMTAWQAGWRWEKEPQKPNHRWYPPQSVIDAGLCKGIKPMGLSSPEAKALILRLSGC